RELNKFFFFSSRRQHTRWPRDWSSDVCSSDLSFMRANTENSRRETVRHAREMLSLRDRLIPHLREEPPAYPNEEQLDRPPSYARSEERRVGKECRARVEPRQEKQKIKT